MINIMDKYSIIKLKKEGQSNRAVERITGIDRKTVSKYWDEYQRNINQLSTADIAAVVAIQEAIVSPPSYDASNRRSRRYSNEMDKQLEENRGRTLEDIIDNLKKHVLVSTQVVPVDVVPAGNQLHANTKLQTRMYDQLCVGRENNNAN